ncbi:MAG TPA: sorbosone dehydrogenase, partial [Chitinophagaceae bacterium]|nr:sorbosone dehydrogenase [Chitinophagaceae bacterium]
MRKNVNNKGIKLAALLILTAMPLSFIFSQQNSQTAFTASKYNDPALKLPEGFQATIIAEIKGRPRHLVATRTGELYLKLKNLVDGKGIVLLSDEDGDGHFKIAATFGNYAGTGITMKNGYLYASSDSEVFRYKLDANEHVIDTAKPEKIITGLKAGRQHQTKSIVLDNEGYIYVNIGAYSNSCQERDRGLQSKGIASCPILDSAGGIWRFRADRPNQSYRDGIRYATGLRNVMGLDWYNFDNSLYVMQHGRDNLNSSWPQYFDTKQSANLPSEVLYKLKEGDNAGWPYAYYD